MWWCLIRGLNFIKKVTEKPVLRNQERYISVNDESVGLIFVWSEHLFVTLELTETIWNLHILLALEWLVVKNMLERFAITTFYRRWTVVVFVKIMIGWILDFLILDKVVGDDFSSRAAHRLFWGHFGVHGGSDTLIWIWNICYLMIVQIRFMLTSANFCPMLSTYCQQLPLGRMADFCQQHYILPVHDN
jgi:hypothetical protein